LIGEKKKIKEDMTTTGVRKAPWKKSLLSHLLRRGGGFEPIQFNSIQFNSIQSLPCNKESTRQSRETIMSHVGPPLLGSLPSTQIPVRFVVWRDSWPSD
jgi:hypothetical protein